MRILVANFFPAFAPPTSGGEQRYFHLYRHLSMRHDITLFSATFSDAEEERVEHSPTFREYRIPKPAISNQLHWDLDIAGIGPECSAYVVGLSSGTESAFRRRFRQLVVDADLVIHESPFTFPLDEDAFRDTRPRVYASYNVEHRLAGQMLKGKSGASATAFIRFVERMLVRRADLVFATSSEERELFISDFECAQDKLRLAPNGFEPHEDDVDDPPRISPYAVFLGSGHPPNVEAARFICESLAPACPDVEFRILGSVCSRLATAVPPNVILMGFVPEGEMRRQLRNAAAALNPLFSGAGTNLKMLQYMEAGAPILSTKIGARGLEVSNGVEFQLVEPEAMGTELRRLVAEPWRAKALGQAARRKAYSTYAWSRIASQYAADLEALSIPQTRPRLLVVNDFAVAGALGGGEARILNLLKEVAAEFDVEFLCLWDGEVAQRTRLSKHLVELKLPKTAEHKAAEHRADHGSMVSVRDIVASEWILRNEGFVAAFRDALARSDAVVFEHPYLAPLAENIGSHVPVVYSSLNVESNLKAGLLASRPEGRAWSARAAYLESQLMARADLVLAVSEEDAREFRQHPGVQVVVVENGVRIGATHAPEDSTASNQRACAVFLGSSHPPNVEAAAFIVQRVAPALPAIDFAIVGSVGQAIAHLPRPANVILHGVVTEERKRHLLGTADLAINPMFSGGGSSLKVPDFLAFGLPLVSTRMGVRGFSLRGGIEYVEAPADNFASAVAQVAADSSLARAIGAAGRRAARRFSWPVLGARYRRTVRGLLANRRPPGPLRILVVTYRFAQPAPGGAESYLNNLVSHLGRMPDTVVDVAACDVMEIQNRWHFSAQYSGSGEHLPRPQGVRAVHRFPIDPPRLDAFIQCRRLFHAWMEESCTQLRDIAHLMEEPVLMGGWNFPENDAGGVWRWSSLHSQIGATAGCHSIRVGGSSPRPRQLRLFVDGRARLEQSVEGDFLLETALPGERCIVELRVDEEFPTADDPRVLGVAVRHVAVQRGSDWKEVDLGIDLERMVRQSHPESWIDSLIEVTEERDPRIDALFPQARGPHSRALAHWLAANTGNYDIVLVQGVPFAPVVWVPPIARARRVPVALLPHFHVEDRYYHWRAYYDAFREADCVLAAPSSMKRQFLDKLNVESRTVAGGGIDLEEYDASRLEKARNAFREIHRHSKPYVLVLGRKAAGKNYAVIWEAVLASGGESAPFEVVMIGPDDDGVPADQPGVRYYGAQPRDLVLGALAGCACLANMSVSESFGIVLLEAWAAMKPVIAQRHCMAFTDLVREGENGFLAETPGQVLEAVRTCLSDPVLATAYAASGRRVAEAHSWQRLAQEVREALSDTARGFAGLSEEALHV